MSDGQDDVKPASEDVKPKMTIVVSFNDDQLSFKIKPSTPFKKVFEAAAERFNVGHDVLVFHFEGVRVRPENTPLDFPEMEEGSVIDANLHQVGGGLILKASL
ncbi:hypothetical protein EIP91_001860 [Steccherinum ochraceum]|uniref:Rad60/SUMO-like domain-containing protein n=1 Tax=Steccherinum ochraceum TaxID=92696 RepID=A0A4R0RFJ2_9APHY|nr:hypothetical protein EIP91_001860 [Steccherinum ochraceum]